MDVDAVTAEVAAAVGLAEGPAGVADVLRVIARHEPVGPRRPAETVVTQPLGAGRGAGQS